MAASNVHIIAKHILHLGFPEKDGHFQRQDLISKVYWEKLVRQLEVLFDRYIGPNEVVRLDTLKIDLGRIPWKNFEEEFVKRAVKQMEEKLKLLLRPGEEAYTLVPFRQNQFQQWLSFLESGTFDWRVSIQEEAIFLRAVLDSLGMESRSVEQLRQLIKSHPKAFERLIFQHQDAFLKTLVELYTGYKQEVLPALLEELRVMIKKVEALPNPRLNLPNLPSNATFRLQFWKVILGHTILERQKRRWEELALHFIQSFTRKEEWVLLLSLLKKELDLDQGKFPYLKQFIDWVSSKNVLEFQRITQEFSEDPQPLIQQPEIAATRSDKLEPDTIPDPKNKPPKNKNGQDEISAQKTAKQELSGTDSGPPPTQIEVIEGKKEQQNELAPDLSPTKEKKEFLDPKVLGNKEENPSEMPHASTDLKKAPEVGDATGEQYPLEEISARDQPGEPSTEVVNDPIPQKVKKEKPEQPLGELNRKEGPNPKDLPIPKVDSLETNQKKPEIINEEIAQSKQLESGDLLPNKKEQPLSEKNQIELQRIKEEKAPDESGEPEQYPIHPQSNFPSEAENDGKLKGLATGQAPGTAGVEKREKKQQTGIEQPDLQFEKAADPTQSKLEPAINDTASVDQKLNPTKTESSGRPYRPFSNVPVGTAHYIFNAGVIMLHPFLLHYFKALKLVERDQFINDLAQQKAIHLIQYLATRERGLPEYELLLPKFLCNLPFDVPIEREVEITESEMQEGEELLMAAIKHWGALGDASPDALREGFLQREGKLEKRQNGWYLKVEQKTLDILLGKLPWGLGIIKLPWMEELLRVEWA